ncbi:MAG: CRISPR-associated endonuclease Cas1, partial [Cytophagales bacterium]|nr:CRISPR-associated endonuclease Cas1 [Cytophagales bacterium]
MKKSYYLFNPGRLSRKDNTLKFTPADEAGREGEPRYLPVESVETLFVFGSLDANSALYNFLGKAGVVVHFFDYYEHYTGSFFPKEYLLAGKVQIAQTESYLSAKKRMVLARKFVEGAAFNMLMNLRYYQNRDKDLAAPIAAIEVLSATVDACKDVPQLMGVEGNIRQCYYGAFEQIVPEYPMNGRSKQPPANEV